MKRDVFGEIILTHAERCVRDAKERAALLAELGWFAEDGTALGRYAATTRELRRWVSEQQNLCMLGVVS